jgi:hypothetical protein
MRRPFVAEINLQRGALSRRNRKLVATLVFDMPRVLSY